MSDDEGRREDARIEAAIDRGLRSGYLGLCEDCGDITSTKYLDEDGDFDVEMWLCRRCQRNRG